MLLLLLLLAQGFKESSRASERAAKEEWWHAVRPLSPFACLLCCDCCWLGTLQHPTPRISTTTTTTTTSYTGSTTSYNSGTGTNHWHLKGSFHIELWTLHFYDSKIFYLVY